MSNKFNQRKILQISFLWPKAFHIQSSKKMHILVEHLWKSKDIIFEWKHFLLVKFSQKMVKSCFYSVMVILFFALFKWRKERVKNALSSCFFCTLLWMKCRLVFQHFMFVKRKISNFFIIFHIVEEKVNYSFDLVKVRIWHRGLKHQFYSKSPRFWKYSCVTLLRTPLE